MLNYDGKVGAVGRVPNYMRKIVTTRIVRFDIEREMPVRGPDGFCVECSAGETGEAIGQILDEPGKSFEGYSRAADTEKKILRDVFAKGDAWFRTGDLMKRDGSAISISSTASATRSVGKARTWRPAKWRKRWA